MKVKGHYSCHTTERMAEVDELDINPLFKALQGKYFKTYENAQDKCFLICIPCTESLQGVSITQGFVETHLLRPSPFFKGQYETEHSKKSVSFDDSSHYLVPIDGFYTKDRVKITSEELGYNKNDKPYRILILESPLDADVFRQEAKDEDTSPEAFKPKTSLMECRQFLKSYPEFSQVLKELDENLVKFNKNYMLLKDYLEEASEKLQDITCTITEKCLKCSKHKLWMNPKYRDMLSATVETYAMATVHNKVYQVICTKFTSEDAAVQTKYRKLTGLSADHLGVSQYFSCPLPSAVVELAQLDGLSTPIEKLYCLKATFESITDDISIHVRECQPPGVSTEDAPCLTSDDLIPILVTVLIQAKCGHIYSDIYYMENFYWSAGGKDRDSLSYCLVTFKAAVQYLSSQKFDEMDLSKSVYQNEISIDELMAARWESQQKSSSQEQRTEQTQPRVSSQIRLDRQMANITKMFEESSLEMGKNPVVAAPASIFGASFTNFQPTPDVPPDLDHKKKEEQMGDFLSSLQDDMFIAYGKQS